MSERLDQEMLKRELVLTRSQARMLIKQGDVAVNGKIILKPGANVSSQDQIEITANQLYVSRGAFKLVKAVEEFNLNFQNLIVADCGASTGGFTEVLLQNKAKKVYAIDVGHDQLSPKIALDKRVVNIEGVNLKNDYQLPEKVDACVADLSFISLKLVLKTMLSFLKPKGFLILLIKPQFEAGKEKIGKGGIVDPAFHEGIISDLKQFFVQAGLIVEGICESPIKGKKGNTEYLVCLSREK